MIILTIRTDKPEAELSIYDNEAQLAYETWLAHRQLSDTIHHKIESLLASNQISSKKETMDGIEGIVIYVGPGSFTGLRIGISVANALATGLRVPIIGTSGKDWQLAGIKKLLAGENQTQVLPDYGGEVYITAPKK